MKKNRFFRLLAASLAACSLLGGMATPSLKVSAEDSVEVAPPRAQTSHLENIVVTVFWPPNPNVLDIEEHFRLMDDFGVTEVFGAGNGCDTPEIQAKFLELAEKHGMTLIVSDGSFDKVVLGLTEEEIKANVAKYKNNPVVTGFHLQDEPSNANVFIDAYKAIREEAPHLDGHINFIHMTAVGGPDGYNRKMGDWLSLTNGICDIPTWLMYDYYPFENGKPFDYSLYLLQLDTVRKLGLRNDVPTAYYLQGMGVEGEGQWYLPSEAENRYQVYSSLAYGFKKLSYFLWSGHLVSNEGVPNELYHNAARVNAEALVLGPILAGCDAVDVYMTQTQYEETRLLPEDYILSVTEGKNADMILSRLVHKDTGRNYIMLVNNDMTAEQSITFTVDEEITSLEVVSKTDGTLSPYAAENGAYTVTLAAGDGILLALPEDYICPVDMERANTSTDGVNLASIAKITATSSTGQDGWYVANLVDGESKPSRQRGEAIGWQSEDDANPVLTFDFGEPIALDTVKIYPSGAIENRKYGVYMPRDFTLSVSDDGKTWTHAATVTDYEYAGGSSGDPLCTELNGAVGRFLRLEVTEANLTADGQALTQIGEIEIFGSPAASKAELADLVKEYVRFGGDTAAELYVTALAAAEDASSRQGYVDLLVKKMSPVVEELEANYQPPTEDTDDSADGETETDENVPILSPTDTAAPTETEAPADVVTEATETTTEDATATICGPADESGCGSVLGFGAASLLVASGAGVALRKKKED